MIRAWITEPNTIELEIDQSMVGIKYKPTYNLADIISEGYAAGVADI